MNFTPLIDPFYCIGTLVRILHVPMSFVQVESVLKKVCFH